MADHSISILAIQCLLSQKNLWWVLFHKLYLLLQLRLNL